MTQPPQPSNLHELARSGNPRAISALLNQSLKSQKTRSKVAIEQGCLHVILEAEDRVPDRTSCLNIVRAKVVNWEVQGVERVRVYGRQLGETAAAWQQEFAVAVGGYSNLLFSQSRGTTNAPATDTQPTEKPPAPSLKKRHRNWMVLVLLVSVTVAIAAFVALELSGDDETSPPDASSGRSPYLNGRALLDRSPQTAAIARSD